MRVDVLAATAEGGPGGVVATRALVLPVARQTASTGALLGLGGSGDDSVPVLLAVVSRRGTRARRRRRLRLAVRGRRAMIDRPEVPHPRRRSDDQPTHPRGAP